MLTRGFTEDITTGLARHAQLFVIGRESALVFGEGARNAQDVGQAAGVRFVVEGSLRWAPGRVRITAKLVHAADEAVIWADQYDGPDEQLFAFQDEIVGRTVAAVVQSVDRQSHQRSRHSRTESLSAYELFLRGRELRRTHSPANAPAAELLLERATLLDPDFAPAHAELAFLQHFYIGMRVGTRTRAERLEQGFMLARRAYALAPDLPFASLALGNLYLRAHEHDEADRWARRSVRLGPGDAESYVGLANVLQFAGRSEEALELMHIANRYNPIRPPMHEFNLARALAWTGRFEQALPVAQSCKGRAPGFWPCTMVLAVTLAHLGRLTEAAATLAEWRAQCGFDAPQAYLDHGETVPGPEFDRLREGLWLAGLARPT
jgi:adenylate cyclase